MHKKNRILVIAKHPTGGIATYLRFKMSRKEFKKFHFTFLTPSIHFEKEIIDSFEHKNLDFLPIPKSSLEFLRAIRNELNSNGKYCLVHSHGFSAGALTQVMSYSCARTKHLMTAHDVFTQNQFVGLSGKIKKSIISFLFKRIKYIHTVTKEAEDNLISYFPAIPNKNIHLIIHGVNTQYFSTGKMRNLRTEIGINNDTLLIGFFGRFMAQKGFRTLVNAVELIDQSTHTKNIKVCTFGWGGFIREDYEYIEKKGLSEYFHQFEHTNDMPSAIKGMDLVAMPSRWEACGLLAMEVMAAGVPLIATHCVGLREVINETPVDSFDPDNANQLAAKIIYAINNIAVIRKDFELFQVKAIERFDIQKPAEKLSKLFKDIIE